MIIIYLRYIYRKKNGIVFKSTYIYILVHICTYNNNKIDNNNNINNNDDNNNENVFNIFYSRT